VLDECGTVLGVCLASVSPLLDPDRPRFDRSGPLLSRPAPLSDRPGPLLTSLDQLLDCPEPRLCRPVPPFDFLQVT